MSLPTSPLIPLLRRSRAGQTVEKPLVFDDIAVVVERVPQMHRMEAAGTVELDILACGHGADGGVAAGQGVLRKK